MNGHGTEPPDEPKPNIVSVQNESIFCVMEIKEEPIVKQEVKDDDDGVVTVSTTTNTANGSHDTLNDVKQPNDIKDFADFYDLVGVKSEEQVEKVKENMCQNVHKRSDETGAPEINTKNVSSNRKHQKSNGSNVTAQNKIMQSAKENKANISDGKKNSPVETANRKRHKCSLCNYVTDFITHLKAHIFKHTGEKPYPCTICPERFTQKMHLQEHIKTHVDEFLFSCSICSQGFHHNEEKLEHEAACKVRRYECHICKELSTLQKSKLVQHLRIHTGEKPFQCDHCSMKFNHTCNFKRHRRTHTNPRPLKFNCSVCFKNFSQQAEKERHEANCKRSGYKCDLCKSYTTSLKPNLIRHMHIHKMNASNQTKKNENIFALHFHSIKSNTKVYET